MEPVQSIALVVAVVFGLFLGHWTAQTSIKREQLRSGGLALVFNYLASMLMAALAPIICVSALFFHLGIVRVLLLAIVVFVVSVALMIPVGLLEKPALDKAKQEDQGWTEKDARTSGL